MRKAVIQTVVQSASLGLALFFSGPALAASGRVFGSCTVDAAGHGYTVAELKAGPGFEYPKGVAVGAHCVTAINVLIYRAGCRVDITTEFWEKLGASPHEAGNHMTEFLSLGMGTDRVGWLGGSDWAATCP